MRTDRDVACSHLAIHNAPGEIEVVDAERGIVRAFSVKTVTYSVATGLSHDQQPNRAWPSKHRR